ncbi:MAG: sulfurtransferase-like selenium metabolism protein YedF [Catonella sp.]|uniref:sulfurtransferase-like selenium metabolism protein YedF n=1 Tax=Catonella sp. TaxID=2382125 RepID=UPI003FA117BF
MEKKLDCRGMACPLPVVTAKKAIEEFTEEGIVEVIVDNETAVQNLLKLAAKSNFNAASEKKSEEEFVVRIEVKTETNEVKNDSEKKSGPTTIVISGSTMGSGDDELGKNLMKAYIFALTNVTPVPDNIIFYNGGAYLTVEGSASLEDLKNLEKAGVNIMTCGTCLNFYGIADKLSVGQVSNMYDIAQTMADSGSIIRP